MNKTELYIGIACLVVLIATVETSDVFTRVMLGLSTIVCIAGAFDNDRVDRRELKNDTESILKDLNRIVSKLDDLKRLQEAEP